MSGDSRETNPVVEKEVAPSVDTTSVNQPEKSDKGYYCDTCNIPIRCTKNYEQHVAGRKHLRKVLEAKKKKKNPSEKKSKSSEKKSKTSSKSHSANFKGKSQDTQNCVLPIEKTNETMNNSPNRYYENNKYNSSNFEKRYSNYYSSNYRSGKHYYSNRPSYSWNSYSNSPRMPNAPNRSFNYRPRHQFYSESGYNSPHSSERSFENNRSFFNPFKRYGESSNTETYEQNLERENHYDVEKHETSISRNPFSPDVSSSSENQFKNFSEDLSSLLKTSKELTSHEMSDSNAEETNVSSPQKSANFSDENSSASKKRILISRIGEKRVVFRSRSLSSSESDKKRKDKTDIPESEEQKIQEWTDSLLETNHNQITRLINPSNHKEKAAVNRLITKFSKTKRKENLTRTLRTNSSELTDNDIRNLNEEIDSINQDVSSSTEGEEISIVLDSKTDDQNLEQNFCSPSTSQSNSFISNNSSQDKNNKNKSSKSPVNGSSKMYIKKGETIKVDNLISDQVFHVSNRKSKEKNSKRKSTSSDEKVGKKHKTRKNLVVVDTVQPEELITGDSMKSATSKEFFCPPFNIKAPDQDSSVLEMRPGVETIGGMTVDPTISSSSNNKPEENLVFSPDVSVDTLIQLFASGNVKVKEEFNDPIMDAIKEISSDELISACSNNSINICQEVSDKNTTNKKNLKEELSSEPSVNENNCINPIILGSAAIEDDTSLSTPPVSNSVFSENASSTSVIKQIETVPLTASASDKPELHNPPLPGADVDRGSDNSLLNENKTKVEVPPYLDKLIKELQEITSEEEKIKENIIEAESKIAEYTSLLEEWKTKKKLLHEQEEALRKQRNSLIKQMQNPVKSDNDDKEKNSESSMMKDNTLDDQSSNTKKQVPENSAKVIDASKTPPTISSPLTGKHKTQKKNDSLAKSPESDEIVILPSPQKPQPVEIIICDDDENTSVSSQARTSRHGMDYHTLSNKKSTVYDLRCVDAHTTVINCLVVFEEYLYTCSNDNTAKRFSLKDSSLSVTYVHSAKNVTEIVVEKMQNEALVFTSCSTRVISLFIASSGTKIKSFFPPCAVMSICKGWNRFYSGLANGSINLYNWKYDEIEMVRTEHPASRIATAHQGRLHVLVILSSEGNISIRDAETGLLIRYVKINIKHPSLMCLHNDLVYLSSADKSLSILDIMSGRIEKKLYMNCHTTGLAVYNDHIFTISYSGLINCYNKIDSCDKRIFYGAGKGGLTCVHVYQNWVFTGNRKGDVALFHFDPNSLVPCEFPKCDIVYGLKEDLEYHIEKDHLQKKKMLTICLWKGCDFKFPRGADIADKMNHVKTHIYPMDFNSASVSC